MRKTTNGHADEKHFEESEVKESWCQRGSACGARDRLGQSGKEKQEGGQEVAGANAQGKERSNGVDDLERLAARNRKKAEEAPATTQDAGTAEVRTKHCSYFQQRLVKILE